MSAHILWTGPFDTALVVRQASHNHVSQFNPKEVRVTPVVIKLNILVSHHMQ